MTCFSRHAFAATLLVNGDFVQGTTGWWGEKFAIAPDAKYGNALEVQSGYAAQDKIVIQAGRRYRISLNIRSIDAPAKTAFVQISFRGPGVDPGWRGIESVQQPWGTEPALVVNNGIDNEWHSSSVVVQAPEGANQMILYLRKAKGQSGAARFSRISVTATDDPVTTADTLQGALMRAKLLPAPIAAGKREALLAAIIKSGGPPARTLTLADHGATRYHVQVGALADAVTLHAATDLANYLKRMTGSNFGRLADDNAPQEGPSIVIGLDNRLARALCPSAAFETLRPDGFVLCTSGENLVIAGTTSRGTLYGVNWFLDRVLGVKWLAPDATYVPSRPTLQIDAPHDRQVPRFAYREVLSWEGQDKAFRAHNLLNGESHGPSFEPTPAELDDWDHSWLAKGGDASFWDLLPRDKYWKSHPDWYAGGQVAMMNADVRRIMAEQIVERLKALPDYRKVWFGIHDMDWGWDMDADSRKFADQHGGNPSAPLVDMVEDVAKRVRAVMPGARFAFNAYHWGFAPPAGMVLPDYILVYPMTIQVDYSTPLNLGRNVQLGRSLAGWNVMAKHMLVWDHVTNFAGFLQPTPNIYPIGASIKWLATLPSVSGYFAEGSWATPAAEFASLRVWMIGRLLWDPRQDVHQLVTEYCRDYFGAAAPQLVAYIDLMHAALAASGDVLSEQTPVNMKMYSPQFVAQADKLFDKAEQAVASDPALLARVRQARMPLDFVILVRRREYQDAQAVPGWQLDYAQRIARFNSTVQRTHVSAYRQEGDLDGLNQLLAIERRPASRPAPSAGLPSGDWSDIQDLGLNIYSSARIVADATASDGAAIRMPGDSSVWAAQLKLDKLPREGKWDLFVDVRVAGGGEGGVRVGSYPPMDRFEQVPASALNRGRYQSISVPGGPFVFESDHEKGVYVQAVDMKAGDAVFVDRVVAVRHK
ncbi:DUF4838 domain-containing protein [Caballeronia mineralivorans]|nr:DUF4838 domain-containing protein [Caballeronia mineralivorans]